MSRVPPPVKVDVEYQSIYRSEIAWVGITELPAQCFTDCHRHDFWELIYIKEGQGTVHLGQERYHANSGDLFVYPPSVEHYEVSDAGDKLVMKVLSLINTSDMDYMSFWVIGDVAYTQIRACWLTNAFEQTVDRIIQEIEQMDTAYTVRMKALSFEFQSLLVRFAVQQNGVQHNTNIQQHQHVIRSRQFIEEHFQQNIHLTDIAAESYVSTYYLSHIFKEYTGFSPMNYLAALRIRKAQELLEKTDHSVSEISQLVGYEDLQHFSNAFKKSTGYSPRTYRQMHQKEK